MIREALTRYYDDFGLRGVLSISAHALFGRPKEIVACHPRIRNPIHVRLRTSDVWVYKQVLVYEEYDFNLPFSPKIIVDAGANIGVSSIYFTHRYPEAKVIAIEPEASNFALLARNVQPYPSIIPICAALWNRDGEIAIGSPEGPRSIKSGFVVHQDTGPKVRAVTMGTLMREMHIPAIDLAKIDIEGAEQEVFQDARWLSGMGCLMIELHDRLRPGCSEAVEPVMHGFTRSQRGETTFYVREGIRGGTQRL